MINWKSILSSYNDKPTLLEWLKLVEKALKESVLASVTTEQDANKDNTKLIFNFEDGTQIATEFFPTKGEPAPKITSIIGTLGPTIDKLTKTKLTFYMSDGKTTTADAYARTGKAVESFESSVKEVTDESTVNTIKVNYDDSTSNSFEISSARGKQGEIGPTGASGPTGPAGPTGANGVSITGIDTVSDEVVGDETLTTLRAHYSNNTSDEFVVTAKNGKSMFIHDIDIYNANMSAQGKLPNLKFKFISSDNTKFSMNKFNFKILFDIIISGTTAPPSYYKVSSMEVIDNNLKITYFLNYPLSLPSTETYSFAITDMQIIDTITEL